jgi:hypothetical protein
MVVGEYLTELNMKDEIQMNNILKLSVKLKHDSKSQVETYSKLMNISETEFKRLYKKIIKVNNESVEIIEYIKGASIKPNHNTENFLKKGGFVKLKIIELYSKHLPIIISIISLVVSIIALNKR